jgi:hypothetical protein
MPIAIYVCSTACVLICAYYVLETLKVKAKNMPIYVRYRKGNVRPVKDDSRFYKPR